MAHVAGSERLAKKYTSNPAAAQSRETIVGSELNEVT